jgi:transketolase
MANAIRFLAMDAVEKANSGHPGMPMGMADVATVLFTRFLKFDPAGPRWPDRDRFVLSAGHGSMLLYALLYLTGYADMTLDELRNFRQLGALTPGHPETGEAGGIEVTSGPLGQGLAMAVGMALAERMGNARFGSDLVDHRTYVIAGDGCLMEGVSQEAISMAGHLKLDRLCVLWDDNAISIDGATDLAHSDDQAARFAASGWHVTECDGHDPEAITAAIEAAGADPRPSMIACKTVIGYGAPTKAGTAATHGAPLGEHEITGARDALGWPHAPFEIPDGVLAAWRIAGARGVQAHREWAGRLAGLSAETRAALERANRGILPEIWEEALAAHKFELSEDRPKWATRKASGETLSVLNKVIPELVGGSADLTGSVNTRTDDAPPLSAENYGGRYIHYGVREFCMAAVMNGMALHGGTIPYGGTFLVFADYMRPAIRLSALMGCRVIYVLTHDSIGLGEDGPTHQPVETLASLRAIPNLLVFRPADAVETAECWALALAQSVSPSVLSLTRQGVPTLRGEYTEENKCARGAYVLAEADGERRVSLLATGSEVSLAMEAREKLQAQGIATAVVSMPCWELFAEQDDAYRDQVLGAGTVRIGIEAAVDQGWHRHLGENGAFVGMKSFGASAPAGALYKHFGITAEAVVEKAKARLGGTG